MLRNPVPWPNGARCAVAFTLDLDADSILHVAHRERAPNMIAALSMLRYGPEIAIPRVLDTYRKFGIKQTFFIPAWCMEQYPAAVEMILKDGHEIGAHGYIHEHANEQPPDDELYWLQRSIDVHVRSTGRRPRGSRSPLYNYSMHSTDFLLQEGFLYDASLMGDDVPYVMQTDKGALLELPSSWALDDWPQFTHSMDFDYLMPIRAPERAWEVFWAEFEAAWEFGGLWIAVWHPMVSGRLARWRTTERMIERMLERGKVWFATLEQIAAHIRKCEADGTFSPRTVKMPYYTQPVSVARPRSYSPLQQTAEPSPSGRGLGEGNGPR